MKPMVQWMADSALKVRVKTKPWNLPPDLAQAVDRYWVKTVMPLHPTFFRGPVLSVTGIDKGPPVRIRARFTDYAHYLYSRDFLPVHHPYRVRVVFAAACPVSRDGYLLAARMGPATTRPGWIQAIGGSPVPSDVDQGIFDPVRSVARELWEETGVSLEDGRIGAVEVCGATHDLNGSVAIAVRIDWHRPAADFVAAAARHLDALGQAGKLPELSGVVAIPWGRSGLLWLKQWSGPHVRYLTRYLLAPELAPRGSATSE